MDDLIYFILVIGWLAFSFYQHAAKKKKQAELRESAYEDESNYPYDIEEETYEKPRADTNAEPDFKKVLEEILLGGGMGSQESKTHRKQSEVVTAKTETADDEINVYQQYLNDKTASGPFITEKKLQSIEERRAALENQMVIEEQEELAEKTYETEIDFDLRKAVIYSEILNRRYAN